MENKKPSVPGIIDAFSMGFEQVHRIIWIILLPIVVDIFLWKGPLLSVGPVIKRFLALWNEVREDKEQNQQVPASVTAEMMQNFEVVRQQFEAMAGQFNLFSLLVANIAVVPSMAPSSQANPAWALEVSQPLAMVLLVIVFELVGLLLGVLYLGLIAQQIRDGRVDALLLARRVWRYWLSIVGLLAIVLGLILVLGIPGGIIIGLVFVVSAGLGTGLIAVVGGIIQIALILAVVYLFFLTDAVVVSEVGPIRAAINSVKVVARNFWAALGLIVLYIVIVAGTHVIWNYLSLEDWGMLAAIVGNAYIASGLTAASIIFYKTRYARLAENEARETEKRTARA